MEEIMRPPGWKKDPIFRAYVEMQNRARSEELHLHKHRAEQMRAIDEAAQLIVKNEAQRIPANVKKH